MYKTKIKEKYQEAFKSFWWSNSGNDEFDVIMTMGNMSLLYCEETGLLLDIYNNKIERFEKIVTAPEIIVEAKNIQYADRFDLQGTYKIVGHTEDDPVLLRLRDVEGVEREHLMLPSRLTVVSVGYKE